MSETGAQDEHRDAIENALIENGGRLHRDEGIELLQNQFDLDKERAVDVLNQYVQFNDRGWTFSIDEPAFGGDVGSLNQPPGAIKDHRWNGLQVLDDEDHPLIPNQESYMERTIEGTGAKDTEVLARAMADPDFSPLLVGEAGTGKDTLIQHVCTKTNRPVIRVNFGKDVRYADLVGTRLPGGDEEPESDEDSESNGSGTKIVWEDGLLTRAVKYGYVFVADEINAAPPEATMPLHQVTEEGDDAELVIREESEVITPHPQFRFVGTMNPPSGGYGGVEQLNDAFKSRFYTIRIDYLDPTREAKLLKGRFEDEDASITESDLKDLCELAAKFREQYKRGDIVTPITTRELIKTIKMTEVQELDLADAATMVLKGHAKDSDERLIEDRVQKELT